MSELLDMEAVIQAAREGGEPHEVDPSKVNLLIVPDGAQIGYYDFRDRRPAPDRESGVYTVADVDSFVRHVEELGYAEVASVWIDPDTGKAVAVLNDHTAEGAGWSDWRVELTLKPTAEWIFWTARDGELLSQVAFAQHIEDGLLDIEEPPSADLLEIAQTFHATTDAAFRSSVRLQSGEQQFRYEEAIVAGAGNAGEMKIPSQILLNIAPFLGEEGVLLAARFRYRISGGKLSLGYKLDRPERVRLEAITKVADTLKARFPRTFLGKPREVAPPTPF